MSHRRRRSDFKNQVDPAQPDKFFTYSSWAGSTRFFPSKIRVEPAQQEKQEKMIQKSWQWFFSTLGLSRLNPKHSFWGLGNCGSYDSWVKTWHIAAVIDCISHLTTCALCLTCHMTTCGSLVAQMTCAIIWRVMSCAIIWLVQCSMSLLMTYSVSHIALPSDGSAICDLLSLTQCIFVCATVASLCVPLWHLCVCLFVCASLCVPLCVCLFVCASLCVPLCVCLFVCALSIPCHSE